MIIDYAPQLETSAVCGASRVTCFSQQARALKQSTASLVRIPYCSLAPRFISSNRGSTPAGQPSAQAWCFLAASIPHRRHVVPLSLIVSPSVMVWAAAGITAIPTRAASADKLKQHLVDVCIAVPRDAVAVGGAAPGEELGLDGSAAGAGQEGLSLVDTGQNPAGNRKSCGGCTVAGKERAGRCAAVPY